MHLIRGKPFASLAEWLVVFEGDGGAIRWLHSDDSSCRAVFSHPRLAADRVASLTIGELREAVEAGKMGRFTVEKFPAMMLRARLSRREIVAILREVGFTPPALSPEAFRLDDSFYED